MKSSGSGESSLNFRIPLPRMFRRIRMTRRKRIKRKKRRWIRQNGDTRHDTNGTISTLNSSVVAVLICNQEIERERINSTIEKKSGQHSSHDARRMSSGCLLFNDVNYYQKDPPRVLYTCWILYRHFWSLINKNMKEFLCATSRFNIRYIQKFWYGIKSLPVLLKRLNKLSWEKLV